jgi:hypothetical protein
MFGGAMIKTHRIVLALYFLAVAYCFVWIPWSVTSSNRYGTNHERLGYGWVWAGPQYPTWSKPRQQGQFSVRDLDPPPGTKATTDVSDVDDFAAQQSEQRGWDAASRHAVPDMTLVAFRVIAISLIAAGTLSLSAFRKKSAAATAEQS